MRLTPSTSNENALPPRQKKHTSNWSKEHKYGTTYIVKIVNLHSHPHAQEREKPTHDMFSTDISIDTIPLAMQRWDGIFAISKAGIRPLCHSSIKTIIVPIATLLKPPSLSNHHEHHSDHHHYLQRQSSIHRRISTQPSPKCRLKRTQKVSKSVKKKISNPSQNPKPQNTQGIHTGFLVCINTVPGPVNLQTKPSPELIAEMMPPLATRSRMYLVFHATRWPLSTMYFSPSWSCTMLVKGHGRIHGDVKLSISVPTKDI